MRRVGISFVTSNSNDYDEVFDFNGIRALGIGDAERMCNSRGEGCEGSRTDC